MRSAMLVAIALALATAAPAFAQQCNTSNGQCNAPQLALAPQAVAVPVALPAAAAATGTSAPSSASSAGSAPVAVYQMQYAPAIPLSAPVQPTFAMPVAATPVLVAAGGCASGSCNSRRGLLLGRRSVSASRSVSRSRG